MTRFFLLRLFPLISVAMLVFTASAQDEGFEFSEGEADEGFDFSTEGSAEEAAPAEAETEGGEATSTAPGEQEEEGGKEMTFGSTEAVQGGAATAADKKQMQLGIEAIKKKQFMPGAVAMFNLLNTRAIEFHQSAEYNLAKSLYKLKLYRSSLHYFITISNAGEGHKNFESAFQWMLLLARNVGDKHKVIGTLSKFQDVTIPEKLRPEFAFYMGQYYLLRGNLDIARQYIIQVEKGNKFYPKVRFLEGIVQFNEKNFEGAVETLKDVVVITDPDGGEYNDPKLRDSAFMVLARIHYAHKQFNAALFYYNKISMESDEWVDVMFEGSWALMQLGRYERSLGNLLTLHSPYFVKYYNPESIILKAVNYYENCRYTDAAKISNQFIKNYNSVFEKLTEQLKKLNKPRDFYTFIIKSQARSFLSGGKNNVFTKIVGLALADRDFKTLTKSIGEIDKELKKIKGMPTFFRSSKLGIELVKSLKKDRSDLQELAGAAAKKAFAKETRNIKDLIGQAYRIRLETTSKIREETMALLKGRKISTVMTNKYYSPAAPDEYEYWPFEGEFWKDELGNYEYVLMRGCRD